MSRPIALVLPLLLGGCLVIAPPGFHGDPLGPATRPTGRPTAPITAAPSPGATLRPAPDATPGPAATPLPTGAPPGATPTPFIWGPGAPAIVAGLPHLGDGLPGTRVDPGVITDLAAGTGDELFVAAAFDRHVWRLAPDGTLHRHAGLGSATQPWSGEALDGITATTVPLMSPRQLQVDAGRLVLSDFMGILRVEADGRFTQLYQGDGTWDDQELAWFPPGQGGPNVLEWSTKAGGTTRLHTLAGDGKLVPGATLQAPEGYVAARDDRGRFYFRTRVGEPGEVVPNAGQVRRYDPQAGTWDTVWAQDTAARRAWVDGRGNLVMQDEASGALTVRRPDGGETALDAVVPAADRGAITHVGVGDAVFMGTRAAVYRLRGQDATRVVGADPVAIGRATETAIAPFALALGPDGAVYFSEWAKRRVLKADAQGQLSVAATTGDDEAGYLAVGPNDDLFVSARGKLLRADGTLVAGGGIGEVLPQADGSFIAAADGQVVRLSAQGARGAVLWQGGGTPRLAADRQGGFYVGSLDQRALFHVDAAGTATKVWSEADQPGFAPYALAVDARGRVYVMDNVRTLLYRYDPATKTIVAVAGYANGLLATRMIDDALGNVEGLAIDARGDLYLADGSHKLIRRIPASALN